MIKLVFSDTTGGINSHSHMHHELLFCSKLRRHKIYIVFHTNILFLGIYTVETPQGKKKTLTEYNCNMIFNIDNRNDYNAFFSRMSK